MMNRIEKEQFLDWLLEEENPSVRYFTLRAILGLAQDDERVLAARRAIMQSEPVSRILALQDPAGWWNNAQSMSLPMYLGTVWQLMLLAELGADGSDERIRRAIDLVFQDLQSAEGSFPHEGERFAKQYAMDLICNDAMIAYGLAGLGVGTQDERMQRTVSFLTAVVNSGDYACRFNKGAECAWGVVKMLRVLSLISEDERNENIRQAIKRGAEYLLSHELVKADFPHKEGGKISEHWFRLGFPRSYQSDLLQTAFVLTALGYGKDERLQPTITFLRDKQLPEGGWALDATWNKMIVPVTKPSKGKPDKWISWQAFYVLQESGQIQ